jgi:hypothetical protein
LQRRRYDERTATWSGAAATIIADRRGGALGGELSPDQGFDPAAFGARTEGMILGFRFRNPFRRKWQVLEVGVVLNQEDDQPPLCG